MPKSPLRLVDLAHRQQLSPSGATSVRNRQPYQLLLTIVAGFAANVAIGQELTPPESLQLVPPASAATPVQKVAFHALGGQVEPTGPIGSSIASGSIGDEPVITQPSRIHYSLSDTNSDQPQFLPVSTTGSNLMLTGVDEPASEATDFSAPAALVIGVPSVNQNTASQADDSKVKVPPAPPVDTLSDPEGRPLTVPSNAATMPDEFYKKSWCNLGDPVYFVDRPTLRIGGWDQVGWHSQDNGLFNDYRRKINIHQSWGFIEKDFVTAGGTGIKFRGDLMYGIDSRRLQAFGNEPFGTPQDWDNSWDNGTYGWALPQLYTEVELQRATVRAGRFLSPFGFENAAPVENFFYSHTYAYTLSHPHTLSGVVAQGCLNDTTSVFAGGSNGWDTDFDQVGFTALGGFSKRLDNGGMLTYGTSFGEFGARGTGYFHSIVYAVQATDKVQFAMQSDWLSAETSDDWGVTGYGIYRFNKCLAAGTRLEYFETDPGITKQQSALAWTSGLNYRPHANVVIRPEVRMDWNGAAVAKGDINLGLDFVLTF